MGTTLHIPVTYSISGDIIDANTDLLKFEIPDASNVTINKVSINSLFAATGQATIEVRNSSSGNGDGIVVTFSAGETYAEQTGSLSLSTYGWIRSGTPNGLGDLNITIRYNH